jgi:2-polyprenyl-3-methyl-5-hydroxy-6-metoxy-1,4-benzoquinol methylase
MPMYRYLGNRVTTTLENLMLGSRFTEMHSGLRAYSRQSLLSLPFLTYSDDFGFDSQLLVDAVTRGQRVVEVPIPTRYTRESSSISVLRSLKYVAHTLAYCARKSAGRGRRGRRSPLGAQDSPPKRQARGPRISRRCVACGAEEQALLYPANVADDAPPSEYRCTSAALARHDDIVECQRCGMVSSVPRLAPEEILERYTEVVDEEYFGEEEGRRELFSWVLSVIDDFFVPGRRLFEIGSNVGLFLDAARARGWQASGIEPSRWAVEVGRKRFRVDLEEGALEQLDRPGGSADAVVMLDVLEHLVDPLDALRRVRPLLDDDGMLVLSTINLTGLHARVRRARWPWLIRPHLHYFTPSTLQAILEEAGFKMVDWRVVPRSFHLSYVANRARSSLGLLGEAALRVSKLIDVKVPVGWLGDVVLVVARPTKVLPAPGSRERVGPAVTSKVLAAETAASAQSEDAAPKVEND